MRSFNHLRKSEMQATEVTREQTKASKMLANAVQELFTSIVAGQLTVRMDSSTYTDDYQLIADGINGIIDTFVKDIDMLPSPVMTIDRDFNIQFMNETGASQIGKTKHDLWGTKCYDAFHTSDCRTERCACHRAMQSRTDQSGETDAHPKNGVNLEIRYQGTPIIKDGDVVGAFEIVTDLTDVKTAQRNAEKQADTMKVLLAKVDTAAEQVTIGTRQVSQGSQTISQGATEQASSIEELSSSIMQIAEQIQDNAHSATETAQFAGNAKNDAVLSNDKMKLMLESMEAINESSTNISKIIKVIDDIAFQTNILALNAAVEAARAGAHGKGFAVVAEEVRNLAAKSANAAKETTTLIEGSIKRVEAGTRIANESAEALSSIVVGAQNSEKLLNEIADASKEQAASIAQIRQGIEQLSQVVQTNSSIAEETAAASEELSGQAELLSNMVSQFNTQREDQLNHVVGEGTSDVMVRMQATQRIPRTQGIKLNDLEFGKY